ncbi:protein rad9 [Ephemerocybe angulata]|uniref:Sister chromatid cohesion protein n=1 Tax=Ephemerocybe angulata TaxID=980116 RepID=A0A8H6I0T0_9AGAR|nr:protein rad9 [Tulosesus angulatus]
MDPHNPWYNSQHPQYRQNGHPPPEQSQNINSNISRGFTNAANQTVQNAQQLLASYPMASVGPTVHVARHVGNLNITAAPPSYAQPSYYSSQPHPGYGSSSSHPPPPPYTDYNQQLSYFSAPQMPSNHQAYWEDARDTSVRMLNDQSTHPYNFPPPRQQQQQPQWPQSNYQTPPFAQSVFQRTVPSSAYPTPPPPAMNNSSSSLAFALGGHMQQPLAPAPPPIAHPMPNPVQRPYTAPDSNRYFDNYLDRKLVTAQAAAPVVKASPRPVPMPPPPAPRTPPPRTFPRKTDDSPDPLSLGLSPVKKAAASNNPVSVTPQKRKPVVEIQSPSAKRMQAYKPLSAFIKTPNSTLGTPRTPGTSVPLTPSTTSRTNTSAGSSVPPASPTKTVGAVTPTPNRIVNRAYVFVPPSPYSTPSSSRKGHRLNTNDTPDLGGIWVGGRPTCESRDRDERGPLDKFLSVVEELFEMEDSLPADIVPDDLPQDYFSTLSTDVARPMLSPALVRKISKYIGQVTRPSKRMRQASGGALGLLATPARKHGRMADVDVQLLSRLLKTLERSVKAAEDMDPFPSAPSSAPMASGTASARSSPIKKSRKSKKAKDNSDEIDGDDDELNQNLKESSPAVGDSELEELSKMLDVARESILYSEELITGCLNTIKSRLTKILYPFVEACSPEAVSNKLLGVHPLLVHIVKSNGKAVASYGSSSTTSQGYHRQQISDLFQALSAVLPKINALVNAESVAMSDSIIIQTVYIAIGPFFVVESGAEHESSGRASSKKDKEKDSIVNKTLGKSAMRGLRLDALSLIRSIFANHDDQRSWIIEEILTSLIKLSDPKQKAGQFRLRDGRSIRTVSALLLQLVQTSAHDVRLGARAIEKKRQAKFALKRQESFSESQGGSNQTEEPFLDEIDHEEIRLYLTGLESATKAAKTIILFLNSRSGKGKATKNSNEAEYRAIFDNLIEDVLAVLYWPEWPAAGLILSIASKFMVASLDDIKSNSQADSNAAKTMALDHLGVIAARIRTSVLKVQKANSENDSKFRDLKPLDEVVSSYNVKQFEKVMEAHKDVAAHLSKRSFEDPAYDSARELTAATLCQELAICVKQLDHKLDDTGDDDDEMNLKSKNGKDQAKLLAFGQKLKAALRAEEASRIDRLAEEIGTIQGLKNSFHPILNVILAALDAPAIFMRTKALRALGQIVMSDATILSAPNVRRGIESHLLDSSPAVRDAAVELIGKYIIDSPEVAGDYYQKVADRMADTDDTARKIDTSTRLVLRMLDEDDTVKDLAIKTVEELWFPPAPLQSAMKGKAGQANRDKSALLTKVSVIHGDVGQLQQESCDLPGFTIVNCIRTIYLFSSAYPSVLSGSNASTLLPYLKNASTPEEVQMAEHLLKIFRVSMPHMPKTAAKFGSELQSALQPMIIKPSPVGGINLLQEAVACMCVVVDHLTHDFSLLINLLKSCNGRLVGFFRQQTAPKDNRAMLMLVFIVALLGEHCNFDHLRQERENFAGDIDSISKGPIMDHIYSVLLRIYHKFDDAKLRSGVLQCLGFLFRAQPTLMTNEQSAEIMDAIFASSEEEGRGRLLRILQGFLISESEKHSAKEKETAKQRNKPNDVDMDELVGNTDGFAASGVSSAIVQRYIDHILAAALSPTPYIQAAALDVLTFTVKGGLAHPLQSFPVIIALETSPSPMISNRALALHSYLNGKHASLLNTRYDVSSHKSFDYQKLITNGYRLTPTPVALLQRWYSLVREKRQSRQDFLKAMVKGFSDNKDYKTTQYDVDFTRYMAENFATFEYKTQEEVFTVINFLTKELSTTGVQLLDVISPAHLLTHLHPPPPPSATPSLENIAAAAAASEPTPMDVDTKPIPLMRTSVIIAMVMLLKAHLKTLYSLSEDKCNKFVVGKKSAIGDKPVMKKHETPISWDRLPYAVNPIHTTHDAEVQKATFLEIWNEDGVQPEPEDDDAL